MKNLTCGRCGKQSKIMIHGAHHRPDGSRPFQICNQCDDDVFFGDIPWNGRELARLSKVGRKPHETPSKNALKMRKSRANKKENIKS